MIVLRALAGLHDLVELAGWLRAGRFQLADLAADWLTDGAFTRYRDKVAELEARCADPLLLIADDPTMPEPLRLAANHERMNRRYPPAPHWSTS